MGQKRHRRKTYLFIENLTAAAGDVLAKHGMSADQAAQIGRAIAISMCKMYPRTLLYIPVAIDETQHLDERNRAILLAYSRPSPTARPFSTERLNELSVEYGLSLSHLYDLLSQTMDAERDAKGLPPMSERQTQLGL